MIPRPSRAALIVVLGFIAILPRPSHSQPLPYTFDQPVAAADVIVVGRLVRFDEDAVARQNRSPDGSARTLGRGQRPPQRWPGTYTFEIKAKLKGTCPESIDVYLRGIHYDNYGVRKLEFPEGALYLLFLKGDAPKFTGLLGATPLIPLGKNIDLPASLPEHNTDSITAAVQQLFLDSLKDARIRPVAFHLLGGMRGDAVVKAARQLMDDPDLELRANALTCLAANQVVEAIPRIAELERLAVKSGGGSSVVRALAGYKTPEAVPYLNALLSDTGSPFIRINAISALNQNHLADKSSIPYLMAAMRDPESQGEVASTAYLLLHKLIPELGPPKSRQAFLNEPRDPEIQLVEQWWADEKHRDGLPLSPPRPSDRPATRNASQDVMN